MQGFLDKRIIYFVAIRIFFFFVFQFTFLLLFGQSYDLKFKRQGVSNGLSNSNIYSIIQDYNGFMWIGTVNGLNRYDGYKYTVYRHKRNDSTTIYGNEILSLLEDNDKNLWVGTDN